jgi:hypothetical protein
MCSIFRLGVKSDEIPKYGQLLCESRLKSLSTNDVGYERVSSTQKSKLEAPNSVSPWEVSKRMREKESGGKISFNFKYSI